MAYTMWFFVANALVIYAYAGLRRGAEVPRYLGRNWQRLFIGAVLTTGSYGVALWAMTRAPVPCSCSEASFLRVVGLLPPNFW